MTKIIATLGPASYNDDVLSHFKSHNVRIIRQNLSHNYVEWHLEAARKIHAYGFDVLLDCPGPKVRLGEVAEVTEVFAGQSIQLEMQREAKKYPYQSNDDMLVFPNHFPAHLYVKQGDSILIDDGKLEWVVLDIQGDIITCEVKVGGLVKSRKGMNMPHTSLDVDFLTARDIEFLSGLLIKVRPTYVAASFVKTVDDIYALKGLVESLLEQAQITDYTPQLCAKLEMGKAVEDDNLAQIVEVADMVMIARGDLALETVPAHIAVPALQEKIIAACKKAETPFIVATQMLESMIDNAVPTRAEISDLYRAVTSGADFVMCSGETAAGKYPKQTVSIMSKTIEYYGSK